MLLRTSEKHRTKTDTVTADIVLQACAVQIRHSKSLPSVGKLGFQSGIKTSMKLSVVLISLIKVLGRQRQEDLC